MTEQGEKPDGITPSQTVGPYFSSVLTPGSRYAFTTLAGDDLVTDDAVGERIVVTGRVTDGAGNPVPDAMIEIWQADGAGRYPQEHASANAAFTGFGRSETINDGVFSFRTVKPGAVPGEIRQAPHINVGVFARGILRRMFTRIYFDDESANDGDAALALVPAERRATLIARRDGTDGNLPRYVFDIRLQGDDETVFFEA